MKNTRSHNPHTLSHIHFRSRIKMMGEDGTAVTTTADAAAAVVAVNSGVGGSGGGGGNDGDAGATAYGFCHYCLYF